MSREAHPRFCERLGVKLPRPTHPYVSTWHGWLYVAFVIDVFARRIVGWPVSRAMRTDFVLNALEQALYARQPGSDVTLIHHSVRGSQYVVIAIPGIYLTAKVVDIGNYVGSNVDKFSRLRLTPPLSRHVAPPAVDECLPNLNAGLRMTPWPINTTFSSSRQWPPT